MTDAQLTQLLRPLMPRIIAQVETRLRTQTFSATDPDEIKAAFSADDVERLSDYFTADGDGRYADGLHRKFGLSQRAFADAAKMVRAFAVGADGKERWYWQKRAEPTKDFADKPAHKPAGPGGGQFTKGGGSGGGGEPPALPKSKKERKAVGKMLGDEWARARNGLAERHGTSDVNAHLTPEQKTAEGKLVGILRVIESGNEWDGPHDLGPVSDERYAGYVRGARAAIATLKGDTKDHAAFAAWEEDKHARDHGKFAPKDGGSGGAVDNHDVRAVAASIAKDLAGDNPTLRAKIEDAALTAAARAYKAALEFTHSKWADRLGQLLGAVFDTPSDLGKLGYNPGNSAGTANAGIADAVRDATGISGHLAAKIAAAVITKALFALKDQLKGPTKTMSDDVGDNWRDGVADLLCDLYDAVHEELGLPAVEWEYVRESLGNWEWENEEEAEQFSDDPATFAAARVTWSPGASKDGKTQGWVSSNGTFRKNKPASADKPEPAPKPAKAVKPTKEQIAAKKEEEKGAVKTAAKEKLAQHFADPSKLTSEELGSLAKELLATHSAEEFKAMQAERGIKGGTSKADRVKRLVDAAKAPAKKEPVAQKPVKEVPPKAPKAKPVTPPAAPKVGPIPPAAPAQAPAKPTDDAGADHPLAGLDRKAALAKIAAQLLGAYKSDTNPDISQIGDPNQRPAALTTPAEDAIVGTLARHVQDTTTGTTFDDLYARAGKPNGLSKHDFQKAMLYLDTTGQLLVGDLPMSMDDTPDPQLLTFDPRTSQPSAYYTAKMRGDLTDRAKRGLSPSPGAVAPPPPGPHPISDESTPLADRLESGSQLDTQHLDPVYRAGQIPHNEAFRQLHVAHNDWERGPKNSRMAREHLEGRLGIGERTAAAAVPHLDAAGKPDIAEIYRTHLPKLAAEIRARAGSPTQPAKAEPKAPAEEPAATTPKAAKPKEAKAPVVAPSPAEPAKPKSDEIPAEDMTRAKGIHKSLTDAANQLRQTGIPSDHPAIVDLQTTQAELEKQYPGLGAAAHPAPRPATAEKPVPHQAARAALDAFGIDHAGLSDEEVGSRLKSAFAPKKTEKAKVGGEKVDAAEKDVEAALERTRTDSAIIRNTASAQAHADEVIKKLKANHTPEELKAIAKRTTGKGGRTPEEALKLIHTDLMAVSRLRESQVV